MAAHGRAPHVDDGAAPTSGPGSEREPPSRSEPQPPSGLESEALSGSGRGSHAEPPAEPRAEPRPASRSESPSDRAPTSLPTLLDTLREPAVRDLAWLLLSPNLLRPQPPHAPLAPLANPFDTPADLDATLDWLRAQDAAPAALVDDLRAVRITRVGRYAEHLLGWFLRHGPAARLIAASVPVRRAGVTLGECDFLLSSRAGARLHWELAVKCYLHAGDDCARLANFVGPNLKDRFDLKLAHLLNHQLPLSAREEFASLGYAGPWAPQMFVKGWLFYRDGQTPRDPPELEPSHGRGWWVTRADWPSFAHAHARQWRVLPRLEWLAPRGPRQRAQQVAQQRTGAESTPPQNAQHAQHAQHATREPERTEASSTEPRYVDAQTLAAQISLQHGPTMVAAFAANGAGELVECSRGFIVPDEWPEQARRYARQ